MIDAKALGSLLKGTGWSYCGNNELTKKTDLLTFFITVYYNKIGAKSIESKRESDSFLTTMESGSARIEIRYKFKHVTQKMPSPQGGIITKGYFSHLACPEQDETFTCLAPEGSARVKVIYSENATIEELIKYLPAEFK